MTDAQVDQGRGIRILRLHLQGTTKPYEVDFRQPDGQHRPLSLIAGPVSTGKSSILEFVRYGLGGRGHPVHEEVLAQVTACLLEIGISGETHVVKRTVGRPSTIASVYAGTLEQVLEGSVIGVNRPIEPSGDSESLSSFLLSGLGLEGVSLKEAPTQDESAADPMSIRDLFWLVYMPNERLDDKNLLFESSHMRSIKLRQVIDVVFNVHDHRRAELADRINMMEGDLVRRRSDLASATRFVEEQEPRSEAHLEVELGLVEEELTEAMARVGQVETTIREATSFASGIRDRHRRASRAANVAASELRDKRTLVQRLIPLRSQYSEDLRKLTMLVDAHSLFDPLHVTVCPSCFSSLGSAVKLVDAMCSLCGTELPDGEDLNLGDAAARKLRELGAAEPDHVGANGSIADSAAPRSSAGDIVAAHLRSTRARLNELIDYVESVQGQLEALERQHAASVVAEAAAERDLDEATTESVAPFLAQRDELRRLQHEAQERADGIRHGLRLHGGLRDRQARVGRLDASLKSLREQLRGLDELGHEKTSMIRVVSDRFGAILAEFGYPKLDRPMINARWEPLVRDTSYQAASSGARTLLSMAWILAIFEIAFERGDGHPGFLMLDSPQKNIGGSGDSDDEFADSAIVDGVYRHLGGWLAAAGEGAQVLVVDNDPPAWVDDVVVRFTRDGANPPYGLIDNEVVVHEKDGGVEDL